MRYIADLHIHSRYSRATSKTSTLPCLSFWAMVKGAHVLGTGDFTHPQWMAELKSSLVPAEPGFYKLRSDLAAGSCGSLPAELRPAATATRFVLSAEISSIYKHDGKVRKIHNLIYVPDFQSAERISKRLAAIGNICSDGRPILSLDARDLLEIVLEQAPDGFLVPAHIWTPWFSLFGSKSGFDSIEECFRDLAPHIFCLETGLSSDPAMNRMVSSLDHCTLLSNSDSHSPGKLCREANIFTTGFDYFSMHKALQTPRDAEGRQHFAATIEFYPEEGKYHHDGHRNCNVSQQPTRRHQSDPRCPVCNKKLTVGVASRVLELADREQPLFGKGSPAVHTLIPLQEILSEIVGVGAQSKTVLRHYIQLINTFGSELGILMDIAPEELQSSSLHLLAEAISRMRRDQVVRYPGFDGQFGTVKLFDDEELAALI